MIDGFRDCLSKTRSINEQVRQGLIKRTFARLVKNLPSWYLSSHFSSCRKSIGLRNESKRSTIEELWPAAPSASNYGKML